MTKQEYKEQIIKNLDKVEASDLDIVDSVVKCFSESGIEEISDSDFIISDIIYNAYRLNITERQLECISALMESFSGKRV